MLIYLCLSVFIRG